MGKSYLLALTMILSVNVQLSAQSKGLTASETVKSRELEKFMSTIYRDGQFMGAVLVAEKGKLVYEKGFGYSDAKRKERFTPETQCYIGSLSKQFTAAGIMILKEKNKIDLDHSIRVYFPELPPCYQAVTIRHMLQHSSGLPVFDDYPGMTEENVFDIVRKQASLRFSPGTKFEYCNANYTLLGMLIEKITGQSLDHFLTEKIFLPSGMKNTYVDEPAINNRKRAVGYYLFGDENNYSTYIGGAASVVSTVEDLYKWDQALYQPSFISKQSLAEIFTPGTNTWENKMYGRQAYGFGWFVSGDNANRVVQHDGGFAGFRSYIERQTGKHNTIIFISNVRHELIGDIRKGIVQILDNQPYAIPKISWANWIIRRAKDTGMKQAVEEFTVLAKTKDSASYYFSEREANSLGYYLLNNNRLDDAIQLFVLNSKQFPNSGNVFDSMGEAYLKIGDKEKALASYRRAFALDPTNKDAEAIIKKLQGQ